MIRSQKGLSSSPTYQISSRTCAWQTTHWWFRLEGWGKGVWDHYSLTPSSDMSASLSLQCERHSPDAPQLGFRVSIVFSVNQFRQHFWVVFLWVWPHQLKTWALRRDVARQNSPGPVLQHKAGQTVDVRGPECHVIQSSKEILLELFHQKWGLHRVCGIELQGEAGGVRHCTVCTVL